VELVITDSLPLHLRMGGEFILKRKPAFSFRLEPDVVKSGNEEKPGAEVVEPG